MAIGGVHFFASLMRFRQTLAQLSWRRRSCRRRQTFNPASKGTTMNSKTMVAVAIVTAFAASPAVQAQSAKDFDELRQEIKRLRDEVDELKAKGIADAKPPEIPGWGQRIEQLETKAKDAAVASDIPGGFRVPGSTTSLRLYGYAEGHAIHDLKASSPNDNFTNLTFQPLDGSGAQTGRTKLTAQTSRFGFDTSTPTPNGAFKTKLEMDFYAYTGDNRNRLRLRQAYGEYGGWLIGQTWSTFMDLDNLPETVDYNGPIGAPFSRRMMVRYGFGDSKTGVKVTFAAEDPEDQFGGGSANERIPQFVARLDKSFDWGAVNIRGLTQEKRSATHTKRGYGLAVGGSYQLTDKDVLMGQYTRVDGDVDQLYGSNGYSFSAEGTITFDKNQGLAVGYAKTFNDRLRGSVAFGMNRGRTTEAVDNHRLQQLFVNLIYSPIKNIELGAEYIHGTRRTFTDETGTMSRFDLMGRYSF